MAETWLPWCIKSPAPRPGYEGYPGKPLRDVGEILFVVNHSGEGWEAYLKQGYRPGETASWTFSNCQDGDMYQHFPLEAITYTSGGRWQNIQGLGVEHEGVKGQPLNQKQVDNDLRLWNDLKMLCPNLRPQQFGQGYREHSELTGGATTCPNGRIQPLYDAVLAGGGGEDMALSDEDKAWITNELQFIHKLIGYGALYAGSQTTPPYDGTLNTWMKNNISGVGLTDADIKKIVKAVNDDAARRQAE